MRAMVAGVTVVFGACPETAILVLVPSTVKAPIARNLTRMCLLIVAFLQIASKNSNYCMRRPLLIDAAGQEPAIHNQRLTCNEGCAVTGKKDCGSNQLLRLAEAPHRRPQQQLLSACGAVEEIRIQICPEDSGRNRVHRYTLL